MIVLGLAILATVGSEEDDMWASLARQPLATILTLSLLARLGALALVVGLLWRSYASWQ